MSYPRFGNTVILMRHASVEDPRRGYIVGLQWNVPMNIVGFGMLLAVGFEDGQKGR